MKKENRAEWDTCKRCGNMGNSAVEIKDGLCCFCVARDLYEARKPDAISAK